MQKISRYKAGLMHFCLSVSIFSIIFLVLIKLWYPEPFFNASGGWQGLKIVGPIDIVLGPLLTLIVFNPVKPIAELRKDLGIIFGLQISALMWGVFTIYQQRPVAEVFWEDSFLTVAAVDLTGHHYPLKNLEQFSSSTPALVYAERPKTKEHLVEMMERMGKNGILPHHQTEFYRPLTDNFEKILPFQVNIDASIKENPVLAAQLDKLLASGHYQKSEMKYFSLKAKYHDMILVFNAKGEQIGYLTP
jgi:hypothetical protein